MSTLATTARRLGLAALLTASLVPAAAAADVPRAADRGDRGSVVVVPLAADAADRGSVVVVPLSADAADRGPVAAAPIAADGPDRVRTPAPVAADALDRRAPVAQPAGDDDGYPLAVPLAVFGLLAAAGVAGVVVTRRSRATQPAA